jgi:CHAT domain-containing protein/Tfp pilus assembly protein PilF
MTGKANHFLEAVIDSNKLSIGFYERSTSIRAKIDVDVKLDKINEISSEVIALIHRSHFPSLSASQAQEDLRRHCVCLFDELLPDQIKTKIKGFSSGDIILLIDEPLVFIPWELLNDGKDYLSLKFNIGRIVRTSRAVRDAGFRSVGVPPKMLVLADPCGDLAGAQKEAKVIRNELDKNGQVIVSTKTANISVDYVKEHIRDYDILHYAGHADQGQTHENSGLRLSDGCFSVDEIIKLGHAGSLPALVFCNACQSAHDNLKDIARGIFGIANAFLTSGVRHYIGCLWKIPDRESVTVAESFYRSVFSGKTIGESLCLTRHELIRQYGWSSLVWASYILYGDPSVVFGASSVFVSSVPKRTIVRKTSIAVSLVFLLMSLIGIAFYNFNRPPVLPSVLIDDIIDSTTQKKDQSLTFAVIEDFKKISSANLVSTQETGVNEFFRTIIRRNVHTEIERTAGIIRLHIKVLDFGSNKIVSLKEFVLKDGESSSKEIAGHILDLLKVGLPRAEEMELTRPPGENAEVHRLLSQSWDLFTIGDFNGALRLCEKIKKIDPDNRDLYKRIGNLYDRLGERGKALNAYTQYAELCKKSNDLKNLSNAYANMGWIFQVLGNDDLAYKHYDKALQIAQLGSYSFETAKAYSLLAGWYAKKKDFLKSKELLFKAIAINDQNLPEDNHLYYLAANYNELGIVFEDEGNYSESLKYLNLSFGLFKDIGDTKVTAEVKERIDRVFGKQKITEKF